MSFYRHITALHRQNLSRPVVLALEDRLITSDTTVLDYGCGRGGDVKRLCAQQIDCVGWDPHYFRETERAARDVVNLGYVVNVIEDVDERAAVMREAWGLAQRVLIVSAQLTVDMKLQGASCFEDGCITSNQTFQKFYEQSELREWIEATLGEEVRATPAAPGVFYVFRDEVMRQEYAAARYRRRAVELPSQKRSDELFEQHRALLQQIMDFFGSRGRLPEADDLLGADEINAAFGSIPRAFHVVRLVTGAEQWDSIQERFAQDLLVYIALAPLDRGGRPKLTQLPLTIQRDIHVFLFTYKQACELADAVLFALGDAKLLDELCRQSPVGKLTGSALYVHKSALGAMPAALRVFEGCARGYIGEVEGANLIKIHRNSPKVSYLCYPDFDKEPHPALHRSVLVHLRSFRVDWRDYTASENPPILHRKEEFVAPDYPGVDKFRRLTAQEERWGLYEDTSQIGTRDGWLAVLRRKNVRLRGHRVIIQKSSPIT
jgi:DNA phosphorothioation-associated putative methyltransferase